MNTSKLIDRAINGYSIRQHESGIYQLFYGRVSLSSSPVRTSHSLSQVRSWRDRLTKQLAANLSR